MDQQFERLKAALADRYAIQEEIGAGGMATVYLAEDLKLHRKVAVKVLRPELAAALGPERFLREIEIAAKLHHPHILALHDSGEADGFLYYVMPYVEGESLRDRLNREKQLPVEDALRIAREVADALGSAHRHDVIHRDIKPENILLEEGHAVVADFGIARAIHAAGGEKLTETGLAMGTPAYMSPEQAMGSQELDGRSDLYSLGCVLYEMLGSEPPFTGATVESIVHQHIAVEPRPVTELRPAVPAEVVAALSRVLSKAPADRFSPAGQFAEALVAARPAPRPGETPPATLPASVRGKRNVIAYAAVAILAIIGAVTVISRTVGPPEPMTAAETPRLAVLPFDNLGSSEDDYFADGITEEITSRIAEISGLRVISRQSTIQYKNSDKTLQQIGEELGVDYVLEGTIRTDRSPDGSGQVRVTPQLIRVSDDAHLWTDRYTANLVPGEIFGIQEQIANQVAEALDVTLLEPERRRLAAQPTDNQEAYDYYLRGRDYFNRGLGDPEIVLAARMYERATELDPTFALAYAALAKAHARTAFQEYGDAGGQSKMAAERALTLAPDLAQAHEALGWYHYWVMGDYGTALDNFKAARSRLSNSSDVMLGVGLSERRLGLWQEALEALEYAYTLDPLSAEKAIEVGLSFLFARRYDEAMDYFSRASAIAPDQHRGYAYIATVLVARENALDGAVRVLRNAAAAIGETEFVKRQLGPNTSRAINWLLPELFPDASQRLSSEDLGSRTVPYYIMMAAHHAGDGQADAQRAYGDSAVLYFDGPDWAGALAYAHSGNREEVSRRVPLLIEHYRDDRRGIGGAIQQAAGAYVIAGLYEAALQHLETFVSTPSEYPLALLRFDPTWNPIRSNPRFQALLAKYEN